MNESESTNGTAPAPLTRAGMGIGEGLPLAASAGGLDDLRRDVQRLFDLEAIKQLKHAYFRCLDTANWDELSDLLHPELSVDFIGGSYEWHFRSRDAYLEALGQAFNAGAIGHHNGHQPEIQLLSATEASGIWYLADHMWMLEHRHLTRGTALYWDRYEKLGGRWLIRHTNYRRLYEMHEQLAELPRLGAHYLAGKPASGGA
jgi:hypothetical protein